MANLRDIKKRISSVTTTKQITRTMEMVSTAKIRRALDRSKQAEPYKEALTDVMLTVAGDASCSGTDPMLQKHESVKHGLIVVIASDRGLAGGFNTTVRYKNISLNAFFTYQAGNVIRLDPVFSSSYSDLTALTNEFKNRFVMTGDNDVPSIVDYVHSTISLTDEGTYASYNYTHKRVAKGDFIRLKSVSLNYDFSSDWISKSRFFKTASVRLTVKDPWLIYSDKALNGRDPEFYNTGGVAMPTTTQFTLSLNLGF